MTGAVLVAVAMMTSGLSAATAGLTATPPGALEWLPGRNSDLSFRGPIGVRCHSGGRVYVVDDLAHHVGVYDHAGRHLHTLGRYGPGRGELLFPDSLHWSDEGLLFIADTGANRIQVWTTDGNYVREFGRDRSPRLARTKKAVFAALVISLLLLAGATVGYALGWNRAPILIAAPAMAVVLAAIGWAVLAVTAPQILRNPRDVWVDPSGVVYVADFGSSAVRVFDRSGVLIRTIPVARPLGLTVSADGLLYVTDDHHHQVRVYDAMGTLVRSFGRQGSAPGEFQHPHGIALGPDGDVYVADRGNARVQAFTPEGIVRRTFASTDEHRPFAPAGVCVTPDRRLLAADTASHRVLAWSLADR